MFISYFNLYYSQKYTIFAPQKGDSMKQNIFRLKQFSIDQTHAGMKVGTDSDLLGTLSQGGRRVLDIGTGTGILTLMLAQRYPEAQLTAIEIDDNAILDAKTNFANSPWAERIELIHDSFQNYLESNPQVKFDAVVCNPPYFDKSLECPDLGRLRARHTSSLPFPTLIEGAYRLLEDNGTFSVCIPPEVLDDFCLICQQTGFKLKVNYRIQALPDNPPKRYVLIFEKSSSTTPADIYTYCMRNADHTYSAWYKEQLKDFLTGKIY